MLGPFFILAFVVLVHTDRGCHRASQVSKGLSCQNDFVNNVSCSWKGSLPYPVASCWITGIKRTTRTFLSEKCKLTRHRDSLPGCSFAFQNRIFNAFEIMPNISIECNGTLVETLGNYIPNCHIKMQAPGAPNISHVESDTVISWTTNSKDGLHLQNLDFLVQIEVAHQDVMEVRNFTTKEEHLNIPTQNLKGNCKVRVKVMPAKRNGSQWSDWSETTSWVAKNVGEESRDGEMITVVLIVSSAIVVVVVLLCSLYRSCMRRGLFRGKPIPNPSEYFKTLHSVHSSNLKIWLNPLSAGESFFIAQPLDHISPIELCNSWNVGQPGFTYSASSNVLIPCKRLPSDGSDTSGVIENSSSSVSSCFSNMGYFMSASSGPLSQTHAGSDYFTHWEDHRNLQPSYKYHLPLLLPLSVPIIRPRDRPVVAPPASESLSWQPQSPESGVCVGGEAGEEWEGWGGIVDGEEALDHPGLSLLSLPRSLPAQTPLPSAAPPPGPAQEFSDDRRADRSAAAADQGSAGRPLAGAVCRSFSMPVESSKAGYFILKERQTTFSNNSI